MCLDILKYIEPIKKKELDNINNITRVINSYDINALVTYIEFACEDKVLDFNKSTKCQPDCRDDVRSKLTLHIFDGIDICKCISSQKIYYSCTQRFCIGRIFN